MPKNFQWQLTSWSWLWMSYLMADRTFLITQVKPVFHQAWLHPGCLPLLSFSPCYQRSLPGGAPEKWISQCYVWSHVDWFRSIERGPGIGENNSHLEKGVLQVETCAEQGCVHCPQGQQTLQRETNWIQITFSKITFPAHLHLLPLWMSSDV